MLLFPPASILPPEMGILAIRGKLSPPHTQLPTGVAGQLSYIIRSQRLACDGPVTEARLKERQLPEVF